MTEREKTPWLALAALSLLAGLARIPGLDRSLWYDELYTYHNFLDSFLHAVARQSQANNHPLASLLAWIAKSLFGTSEVALRSPSVVAGALGVFFLGLVVSRLAGRGAGLAAAVLATLNPAHVGYSQEVRGYALVLLFVPIVVGLALGALPPRRRWLALAVATGLALWSHLTTGVLILGVALHAALWNRTERRQLLASLGAGLLFALVLYAPMLKRLGSFAGRETGHSPLTLDRVARVLELFAVSDARLSTFSTAAMAIFFGLALAGLVLSLRARESLGRLVLVTLATTVVLWSLARPLFYARFFLFLLPLVLACAARAIAALASRLDARSPRVALLLAVVLSAFGAEATWHRASWETQPLARLLERPAPMFAIKRYAFGTGSGLLASYPGEIGSDVQAVDRLEDVPAAPPAPPPGAWRGTVSHMVIVLLYEGERPPDSPLVDFGERHRGLYADVWIYWRMRTD